MADWSLVSEIDDLRATIDQQAASLAAKDKDIERLQRRFDLELDAYAKDHDLQAARSRAEQAERERDELREWKQNQQVHWPSEIKRRNRDLEQAERALAALAPVRDMLILCDELGGIQPGEGMAGYLRRLIDEVAGKDCERAFVAQHGSDSSTKGK